MDYYGQLDFSLLCRLWRDHKEIFQMVDFKDGKHALLKVNFSERQQPDEHGNTHYMKAGVKKSEQKEGLNYYIGSSFKPSQQQSGQSAPQATPQQPAEVADALPF